MSSHNHTVLTPRKLYVGILVFIISLVLVNEYTHTPLSKLIFHTGSDCQVATKVRIALQDSPNQDPTRYTTVNDLSWGYANNHGGQIPNTTGQHHMGPFDLPTEGSYGIYPKPETGKSTPITFKLLTDLNEYGYQLLGTRYRYCNLTDEVCDTYPQIQKNSDAHTALKCNKTLEYEWVVSRKSDTERIYCPISIEATVYRITFTGGRELVTSQNMGKQTWGIQRTDTKELLPFATNTLAQQLVQTKYAHEIAPTFFYTLNTPLTLTLQGPDYKSKWTIMASSCADDPVATVQSCLTSTDPSIVSIKPQCGTMLKYSWVLKQVTQQ